MEAPSLRCGIAACTVKYRGDVDADHLLERVERSGAEGRAAGDAGVGEHDVELAESLRAGA